MLTSKKSCCLVKFKLPIVKYMQVYFWFNANDPDFLRYSFEEDFGKIKTLNIAKNAVAFHWKNDEKKSHVNPISGLEFTKQFRLKIKPHSRKIKDTTWSIYFRNEQEFNEWRQLLQNTRILPANMLQQTVNTKADAKWFEEKYESSSSSSVTGNNNNLTKFPSSRGEEDKNDSTSSSSLKGIVAIRIDFPHELGTVWVGDLHTFSANEKLTTLNRLKQRAFEAMHMIYHSHNKSSSSSDLVMREGAVKEETIQAKYGPKICNNYCLGDIRTPLMGRMMFYQEALLQSNPDDYVLQLLGDYTFPEIIIKAAPFLKPFGVFLKDGIYVKKASSSSSSSFDVFPSKLKVTTTPNRKKYPAHRVPTEFDQVLKTYQHDEDISLNTLLEQQQQLNNNSNNNARYLHFDVIALKDLPRGGFMVKMLSYTVETDAFGYYEMYLIKVTKQKSSWEIKRRGLQFKELHAELKRVKEEEQDELFSVPMLDVEKFTSYAIPQVLGSTSEGKKKEKNELIMREYEKFLKQVIELCKNDPPFCLLEFLGLVSSASQELAKYEKPILSIQVLEKTVNYGDLILFKSKNVYSGIQRKVTGTLFDHIGIVVKRPTSSCFELLEATGEGVTCLPLVDRILAYANGFVDLIALRQLENFPPNLESLAQLAVFADRVEGKAYSLNLLKILKTRVFDSSDDKKKTNTAYFCSELVADALKVLNVISNDKVNRGFWPRDFCEGGKVEKILLNHVKFKNEVLIDCTILEGVTLT